MANLTNVTFNTIKEVIKHFETKREMNKSEWHRILSSAIKNEVNENE
jgi:hypothetical protein